jgi:hypothetical protein
VSEQPALFELAENGHDGNGSSAALSRHVPAGPARLLRDLVNRGLDHHHLSTAAALVLELDAAAGVTEGER